MRALATLCLGAAAQLAAAQSADTERLRAAVAQIERSAEAAFACRIEVFGEPRYDEFAKVWLVGYSSAGDDCDGASAAMQRQGAEAELVFVRRPSLGQVRSLVNDLERTIGSAYQCRITTKGEPQLDPISGRWFVTYLASGVGCDLASVELTERGTELQVVFLRVGPAQTPFTPR